jgi:hypothetical protein
MMGSIGLTGTEISANQQKQQHQGAQCAQTPSFGLSTRVTSSNDANKTKHRYPDVHDILLIGGTSHPRLNQGVSEALGVELGKVREYLVCFVPCVYMLPCVAMTEDQSSHLRLHTSFESLLFFSGEHQAFCRRGVQCAYRRERSR